MEKIKRNWYLILIAIATVVLGAIAVITAIKLYQLREKPVAPTAPESKPRAVSPQCTLEFSLAVTPTPTPTGSLTPTPTPTGSLTPTPTPTATGTPGPTATPTPTGTPGPTATPTPTPPPGATSTPTPPGATATPTTYKAAVEIPVSGFSLPTLGAILGGIIFVVSSLLLIL